MRESNRSKCVREIWDRLTSIGEKAQALRPDLDKVRFATSGRADRRSTEPEHKIEGSIPEMESRFRWLIGTLHLTLRKLEDAGELEAKLQEMNEMLDDVAAMSHDFARFTDDSSHDVVKIDGKSIPKPPPPTRQRERPLWYAWGEREAELEVENNLQPVLDKLLNKAVEEWDTGQPTFDLESLLTDLQAASAACERLPNELLQKEGRKRLMELQACQTFREVADKAERIVEVHMDELFCEGADDEPFQDEIGLKPTFQ